tara:strand:+ start:12602 stop:12901 length:300 start_codon:yes stop_codon:yes gene_type:complete
MDYNYSDWIEENYPTPESAENQCNNAVSLMMGKFPELKLCVGKFNGIFHCWLEDLEGGIIDPTIKQFKNHDNGKYELIANRFLKKHEVEVSTGCVFLDE